MSSSQDIPALVWSCVTRNGVILAEAGKTLNSLEDEETVMTTASQLLHKKPTPGFEFHSSPSSFRQRHKTSYKGMKFHIHGDLDGEMVVWSVACVYQPSSALKTNENKMHIQAFLEKIASLSEVLRETSQEWRYGQALGAQQSFSPILMQQMEMAQLRHVSKMANLQQQIDSAHAIMHKNIELILERDENIESLQDKSSNLEQAALVFRKKAKEQKRKMLWRNAKNGFVLGTLITAGVAVAVVPPLVAIL